MTQTADDGTRLAAPAWRMPLNFWGIRVDLEGEDRRDEHHFDFYFPDHRSVATGVPADLAIRLVVPGAGGSFVEAVSTPMIEKRVYVRAPRVPTRLYDSFFVASRRDTLLPPVALARARLGLTFRHAAAASAPNGRRAVVIRGPSGSGKSVLLLNLLSRGWCLVADDVVPITPDNRVRPFLRPIGVREQSLALHPDLEARIRATAYVIRTGTGATYMTRARDLDLTIESGAPRIGLLVSLQPSSEFAHAERQGRLNVRWNPQVHVDRALEVLLQAWSSCTSSSA